MTLSTDITQADIDAARTYNRAILLEQFPELDLSVGGVVDSLLVDGQAVTTARNTADVNRAYLYQQLQAIAAGTVTVTDDEADRLAANYFVVRQQAIVASGTVVFIVRDNIVYNFQSGYTLRSNGEAYRLLSTFKVYPVGTTGVDFAVPTNVLIEQVYNAETGYQYQFSLPISSVNATPDALRVSGDRFTVDQPFNGLGYVQATTNFEGGTALETNALMMTRALQGIVPQIVGGLDSIDRLVVEAVPLADSTAVGTGNPLLTRDRDNVFNLPTGGRSDIYCRVGAIAQAGYQVEAVVTNYTTREIQITLTRAQSAGVYTVGVIASYTATPPVITSGSITLTAITHDPYEDDGFNPAMPSPLDRAFSARQIIVLTVTDDRMDVGGYVVPMLANGAVITDSYAVDTAYQPQLLTLDDTLTSTAHRPPGSDVLVKAAVPCVVSLGVVAAKPVSYNGQTAAQIRAQLAALINQLPVATPSFNASTVAGLLRSIEPTLTLLSISLNGLVYGQNDVQYALAPVAGALVVPYNAAAKTGVDNAYFTTTTNLVTVALV